MYRSGKSRQVDAWFGEMLGYFRALRAFVSEAAASEAGLIFCC
jgi:hypothetical protein